MKKWILLSCLPCFALSSCAPIVAAYVVKKVEDEYQKRSTDLDVEGEFFQEEFMKGVELSWLEKPQNRKNEYTRCEDIHFTYGCEVQTYQEYASYVNYLYAQLHKQEYYLGGRIKKINHLFDFFEMYSVQPFLTLEEHREKKGHFVFYYSKKGLEWSERLEQVRMVEAKKLSVYASEIEGGYQMSLTVTVNLPPIYVDSDKPPYVKPL